MFETLSGGQQQQMVEHGQNIINISDSFKPIFSYQDRKKCQKEFSCK